MKGSRAVLLIDVFAGGSSLKRQPPIAAGSIGTARPLYEGASLALFELPTGVRLVVPLANLREVAS